MNETWRRAGRARQKPIDGARVIGSGLLTTGSQGQTSVVGNQPEWDSRANKKLDGIAAGDRQAKNSRLLRAWKRMEANNKYLSLEPRQVLARLQRYRMHKDEHDKMEEAIDGGG